MDAITKEESLSIQKLKLFNQNVSEDFFMIRYSVSVVYFVSEKLKQEIENAGCTGIEFQSIKLSLNEWLQDGHREKIYRKA